MMTSHLSGLPSVRRIPSAAGMTGASSSFREIRCIFLFAALSMLLLVFPRVAAAVQNPFDLPLLRSPASHGTDSFAPLVNPVFSDVPAPCLAYQYISYDQGDDNHLALITAAGFLFSYARLNTLMHDDGEMVSAARTNLFTVGKGFWLNNFFGIGVNFSWSRSQRSLYDDYRSWAAGVLFQPVHFLSFGFASRDLNTPDSGRGEIGRTDIYSLSVRPFGNRLTLSADALKRSDDHSDGMHYLFAAHLVLIGEITLSITADDDKNYFFGITAPFAMSGQSSSTLRFDYHRSSDLPKSSHFGFALFAERYRSPLVLTDRYLVIHLRSAIQEIGAEGLFARRDITFYDMINAIRSAAVDPTVVGIVLHIDRTGLGFAQVQEVRHELKRFRHSGKPVHALLVGSSNRSYYLAAAADTIYLAPGTTFSLSGLMAQVYFFKKGLDLAGIRFETIRAGKYKSANEPFTREKMSDESRENLLSLLSDLNEQYLNDIAENRKLPRKEIDMLLETGFLAPEEAQKRGFVDVVEYPATAQQSILKRSGLNTMTVNLENYVRERKKVYQWGLLPHIAVVYVQGGIIRGRSKRSGVFSPESTGDESYGEILKKVFSDRKIRAVVIRVNSGGGSALASDLMWHHLSRLKKKYKKPVVISFGTIAASGGYYIACTGDTIYASRGTITGSIGVVSGKVSLQRLYDRLGINKEVLKMSEFADIFSESRGLTERERQILLSSVQFTYSRFTGKVAAARNISPEQIPDIAEGRVFTGSQAIDKKLVDKVGGLIAAITYAKKIANVRGQCIIEHHPGRKRSIAEVVGLGADDSLMRLLRPMLERSALIGLCDEQFLYLYPYIVEIR